MPFGEGKYDDLCTAARDTAGPDAQVVLIVIDGKHGSGMSAQLTLHGMRLLPQILRAVVDQIEAGGWVA